jgi:leucyl aminopeptidase (aminopeptidase T)
VRGDLGSYDFLLEVLLAVERAGATPLPEIFTAAYLERLWSEAPFDHLEHWDRYRRGWLEQIDRVVTFVRLRVNPGSASREAQEAWRRATDRLTAIEDDRRLPFLVVAVPGENWAQALGMPLAELEAILLPALLASPGELQVEIDRLLAAVGESQELVLRSGDGYELNMVHGQRLWLGDDGRIDPQDRQRGAIVSNLPAGSIYTTVLESETHGHLWLPEAGAARQVLLTFEAGRLVDIRAASRAEELKSWLFSHSGEPERVSHVGIGLNPYLRQPIGLDVPVDEHVYGFMFIALGDNLYMGGENQSSLNVDYVIPGATFLADGNTILSAGKVMT